MGVSASFDQIRELEVWEGCSVPPEDHTTTHPLVEQSSPSSSSSATNKTKTSKTYNMIIFLTPPHSPSQVIATMYRVGFLTGSPDFQYQNEKQVAANQD